VDAVKIRCSGCGAVVERIRDVGNPWLDAGIVPFSTLHYREDPEYWKQWFPADFITESFPGQFRNWFYSMLAMSTVLRREPPFLTIFGYALVFGEDGRPMHKSWGNAIEFNEGAERIGVDVMRWMFAKARPEENILFGYKAADESRRELLVLWNVLSFFVTYARLAGWSPRHIPVGPAEGHASASVLDRWIASRAAGLAATTKAELADYDARAAALAVGAFVEELSTWYLRRSRRRFNRSDDAADRDAAFQTLHRVLVVTAQVLAPTLPFLAEELYGVLVRAATSDANSQHVPDSVHLTRWPDADLAAMREPALEAAMATLLRAVDLGRTLRSQAGIRIRQPLAGLWLALPGGTLGEGLSEGDTRELLDLLGEELNVKSIHVIGDESELVERRVKPLLPVIGRRYGTQVPGIMAAARANEVTYGPDGSVTLGGVTLSRDEVEILATPRPGTAVAHDEGVVVVIDTTLTPELRAEGDAREVTRAVQDLRKQAELALDARIELWLTSDGPDTAALEPYLRGIAADTLADVVNTDAPPADASRAVVTLDGGEIRIALRSVGGGAKVPVSSDARGAA
jgi:isoleucyl-tRNA synthetase